MANEYAKRSDERLLEIAKRLEERHLSYLQIEDTPLKLEQRQKLEGIIKEYLCLVQNERKYTFPSTADIFHRSAATVQDFSGYRACTAWSAIALYAANLLAQPWRKEYRTLRTYSGYYKHEVEANLIGAEMMFELMGYKHTGLGVLTLEGPIDPDKVSFVSRDAIVASVECQILKEIWEGVSKNFTITWLEILEFRENHVGTPEQAIRALNYRFHEKLRHSQTKMDAYLNYPYLSSNHADIISPSIQYPLSTNYNCPPDYSSYLGDGVNYHHLCLENYGNAYDFRNAKHYNVPYHTTLPSTCTSRVPTGCLIELDPPNHEKYAKHHHHHHHHHLLHHPDEVDYCQKIPTSENRKSCTTTTTTTPSSNTENWDYVYDGLRSSGYSKDLGDRDDILCRRDKNAGKYRKFPLDNYDEKQQKQHDRRKLARSQNELQQHYQDFISHKKKSSFDAADLKSHHDFHLEKKLDEKSRKNCQTMPNLNTFQSTKETNEQISQYMRDLKIIDKNNRQDRWQCAWCTYLNSPELSICDMCKKSRHKGNEDAPLASGGKECPTCTLVNEKDVLQCIACYADLKYSPTYI